jgi:hypothetical protein
VSKDLLFALMQYSFTQKNTKRLQEASAPNISVLGSSFVDSRKSVEERRDENNGTGGIKLLNCALDNPRKRAQWRICRITKACEASMKKLNKPSLAV